MIGGRGLWPAIITVYARSRHSGPSKTVVGAISRAARPVRLLDAANMPGVNGGSGFPLPPQLSVTSFHGGQGFSATPDHCELNVDVRTAPAFNAHDAQTLIHKAVTELDTELPAPSAARKTTSPPPRC